MNPWRFMPGEQRSRCLLAWVLLGFISHVRGQMSPVGLDGKTHVLSDWGFPWSLLRHVFVRRQRLRKGVGDGVALFLLQAQPVCVMCGTRAWCVSHRARGARRAAPRQGAEEEMKQCQGSYRWASWKLGFYFPPLRWAGDLKTAPGSVQIAALTWSCVLPPWSTRPVCLFPACFNNSTLTACLQPNNLHGNGTALVHNAWQTAWPGHQHRGLISRQQLLLCLALLLSLKWDSLLHQTARRWWGIKDINKRPSRLWRQHAAWEEGAAVPSLINQDHYHTRGEKENPEHQHLAWVMSWSRLELSVFLKHLLQLRRAACQQPFIPGALTRELTLGRGKYLLSDFFLSFFFTSSFNTCWEPRNARSAFCRGYGLVCQWEEI